MALGSNVGDRLNYLRRAVSALAGETTRVRVAALSSVYETKPVGLFSQPDFLNAVIAVDTNLPPEELLDVTQAIERTNGRCREVRWGPRTLDIDILLYGCSVYESKRLTVPHPRLKERAFVLLPLAELAPQLTVPGTKATVSELVQHVEGKEGVKRCQKMLLAAEFGLTVN